MTSNPTDDETVVFGDEFLVDEILARLPARCAVRCNVLSKRFRQLLTSPHFWLRHRRLGAPLEHPHAARIQCHHAVGEAFYFQFHVVGPTFVIEHAFSMDHHSFYAGTCNGLVLVSSDGAQGQSSVDGLVFNPATKEEARLSLQLPHPGKEDVKRRIMAFAYGPSGKVYKALINEIDDNSGRLMVVSLDGSGGQELRTVFTCGDEDTDCDYCLHTADGKVYFLIDENGEMSVLVFDFDSEAVTRITVPEEDISKFMMLEVQGRPCIYAEKGEETILWLLTADRRWEQLYILIKEASQRDDSLKGVWDCGGGFLFAEFKCSGAYMYNLNEAVGEEKEGSRLTAVSSLMFEHKWPACNCSINISDYQPTLISPASILGDAAFSYRCRESVAPKHEVDVTFLETTQKSLIDPMMLMLSVLRPPNGQLD